MSEKDWNSWFKGPSPVADGHKIDLAWSSGRIGRRYDSEVINDMDAWNCDIGGANISAWRYSAEGEEMANQAWVPSEFPPVGTICNALTETGWQQVRIVAHDGKWCIFKIDDPRHDDYRWSEHPDSFEALPSEEDQAVDEMHSIFQEGCMLTIRERMRALYNAGYRKQPQCRCQGTNINNHIHISGTAATGPKMEDLSDPNTWRAGDYLECIRTHGMLVEKRLYKIVDIYGSNIGRGRTSVDMSVSPVGKDSVVYANCHDFVFKYRFGKSRGDA